MVKINYNLCIILYYIIILSNAIIKIINNNALCFQIICVNYTCTRYSNVQWLVFSQIFNVFEKKLLARIAAVNSYSYYVIGYLYGSRHFNDRTGNDDLQLSNC